jgi:hypothetical protein
VASEKFPNQGCYRLGMFLEQEVPALEQVDFRFRHVATVSLGTVHSEERVVLAPYHEHVQTVARQTKFFHKTFNHVREALERVVELRGGGRVALPVAGIVRRDYAIAMASFGMRSRNMCDEAGKPCSNRIGGPSAGPASR